MSTAQGPALLTADTFRECDDALDASSPIRQGDVLRVLAPVAPWSLHAVVVTADCDLKHSKHYGSLTVVPILQYDHYLAMFVAPGKLTKISTRLRDETRALLRALVRHSGADAEPRDAAVDNWLEESSPDSILQTLGASNHRDAARFTACAEWLRSTQQISESLTIEDHIRHVERGRSLASGATSDAASRQRVCKEMLDHLQALPGDAMFIANLGAHADTGFVAYLRRLTNMPQAAVARYMHETTDPDCVAQRVARLRSPYVFKLTQMLGQVFSSIGLPSEYEGNRQATITSLHSNIGTSL